MGEENVFKYLIDNTPTWFVITVLAIAGVMKYGPKFIKQLVEVGEQYKDKSDKVKNELIAILKSDKERLEKDLERERNRVEELKSLIDKLEKDG